MVYNRKYLAQAFFFGIKLLAISTLEFIGFLGNDCAIVFAPIILFYGSVST